jgi:hypothetical protein
VQYAKKLTAAVALVIAGARERVGWAKRSVPTIKWPLYVGTLRFAHPTKLFIVD